MVGASVATRPTTTDTVVRRGSANWLKVTAKTVGIIAPPMNPWRARHRIIASRLLHAAHPRLVAVNPRAEAVNRARVPSARERYPESGIMMTSAMRYAV